MSECTRGWRNAGCATRHGSRSEWVAILGQKVASAARASAEVRGGPVRRLDVRLVCVIGYVWPNEPPGTARRSQGSFFNVVRCQDASPAN